LFTIARARTPRARLRAALGLQPGHGSLLKAFGGIEWSGDGTLTATSSRGDGGPPCTDAGALEAGAVSFSPGTGTAIDASLVLASAPAAGAVDTRCPAPALGPGQPLAATTLSRRALGKRRIVLRFRTPRSFAAEGYAVRSSPSVTVVLVRGRPLLQRG
jgi:hypothetical protein